MEPGVCERKCRMSFIIKWSRLPCPLGTICCLSFNYGFSALYFWIRFFYLIHFLVSEGEKKFRLHCVGIFWIPGLAHGRIFPCDLGFKVVFMSCWKTLGTFWYFILILFFCREIEVCGVSFQVIMAVKTSIVVFWGLTSCVLARGYQRLGLTRV